MGPRSVFRPELEPGKESFQIRIDHAGRQAADRTRIRAPAPQERALLLQRSLQHLFRSSRREEKNKSASVCRSRGWFRAQVSNPSLPFTVVLQRTPGASPTTRARERPISDPSRSLLSFLIIVSNLSVSSPVEFRQPHHLKELAS